MVAQRRSSTKNTPEVRLSFAIYESMEAQMLGFLQRRCYQDR